MSVPVRFIVIDDDPINNYVCNQVIKKIFTTADFRSFTIPEKGLEYLQTEFSAAGEKTPAVLFLDINMPSMTGWDVLDNFDKLDEDIKKRVKIYILSSSVDERDKERAAKNKYVTDYIVKPLTAQSVLIKLTE